MGGVSVLERRIYVTSDVDRYVGLPPGTARRWIDGYTRHSRSYPPVIRTASTGDDTVSWGEFVEASLLAGFRARGVSLQRLRPAVERLRQELGLPYPLAMRRTLLEVEGRELVQWVQEATNLDSELRLVVVRSGQLMLSEPARSFVRNARYEHGEVEALAFGDGPVLVDPTRAAGRPAVRGVPAEVLAEGFRAGESADSLADMYDLTGADVEAALRYEMRATQRASG
jgi:uncharacterized protein (DUF433 family)